MLKFSQLYGLLLTLLVVLVQYDLSIASQDVTKEAEATAIAKKTLIIVDKNNLIQDFKQSYSGLIKLIENLGHTVDVRAADDTTLKLSKYSEFLYSNILMFCPQLDLFRGSVSLKDILEFIDSGRNLLLTGSHAPGSIIGELANEVGFEFKESSVKREYTKTKLNDIRHIVGDKSRYSSFSYSGTPMKMVQSDLSLEILTNNAPVDDIRISSSSKFISNVLIGAVQARNNARIIASGSSEFFSNKAFESSKQSNMHLTGELLSWLLKEKSILRFRNVQHKKLNDDIVPVSSDIATQTHFEGYTIMDDVEYRITIEIYENGKWSPYLADDVQFEFVRIDPFVRQTMPHKDDGTYVARFKVPDVYGVYKMEVDYKRDGLSYLFSSTQVSVRPLRHNEYERFIYSAYPYYLSAFLMIAYLYIFTFVYLYQKKNKKDK